jgi:hypothetical protein
MTALAVKTNTGPRKIKRNRPTTINPNKRPLEPEAWYTIREVSSRDSPYYTASPATIFRALSAGDLKANYVGRKVLLKGSSIRDWIEGKKGGEGQ